MRFCAGLSMLLFALPLAAQSTPSGPTDRGSTLVAGSAHVSRTSSEGSSTTQIGIQPSLLLFVTNRVAVGGELGLSYFDHENGNTTSWLIGPAARLYFGPSTAKTLPYLGASVQLGSASTSSDGPVSSDSDASAWRMEGVAGLTFMISRQVGIAGELFVQRDETTFETAAADVKTTATRYGLRFGIAAFVF